MDIPSDWLQQLITFSLHNFGLIMLVVAAFFMLLHRIVTRGRVPEAEIVYRWIAVFSLGFTSIYAGIMHIFYPDIAAAAIGWINSPFQYEVGVADLGFGLIGLLSFKATYGFRLATVIGNTFWLWGNAIGHLNQIIMHQNFAFGNAGSWFWLDLVIPLLLIMSIRKLKSAA